MAQLFIRRPILAWVFALFISIAGVLAIPFLPIAQYPKVAPPQLTITTTYPGASPQEIYQGVTRQIEEELNGVEGLLYFESTSDSSGWVSINATFAAGTNIDQASVDVQNAIRRVESRLPATVRSQGINVEEAGAGFLMVVVLTSTDGTRDPVALGDYINRNIIGEIRRIDGVGRAQLYAAQRALRVWIDPDKMVGLNLTPADVNAAIAAQNAQVAAGQIGAAPNPVSQDITATVIVQGQLTNVQQFGDIILRANPDGSTVRRGFRIGQVGSASMVALAHGTNDAQKTMGVITLALITGGVLSANAGPPFWVVVSAGLAIGLGTYVGGWRIIRTLGRRVSDIQTAQGFASGMSTASVILTSSHLGFPLSTTQVATGSIFGAGAARGLSSVRWGIAGKVALAWLLTLPAAAVVGAVAAWVAVTGPVGTIIVAVVLVGFAGAIYAASRRRPVNADNLDETPAPPPPLDLVA